MKKMTSKILTLIVLSLGFFVGTTTAQGNRPPVSWETSEVRQNIGGGEVVVPITVKFRVSKPLTNVSVFTVPEIRRFVTAQPSGFAVLQPLIEYSLSLSFSVPTRAAEGLYEGTIHLRVGSQTIPQTLKVRVNVNYGGNIVAPNAVTLSPDSLQLITGVAEGDSGLYFSRTTPEISQLQAGSILVLPPTSVIPNGYLGRIGQLTNLGNQIFLPTSEASLSEVFTSVSLSLDRQLSSDDLSSSVATTQGVSLSASQPVANSNSAGNGFSARFNDLVVYDRDRNPGTTADQVLLDGSITVNPQLHFAYETRHFHLNRLAFSIQLNENVELKIKSRVQASLFDGEEREFARYRLKPIVIWVRFIPVVFVPEVSLVARAKGTASAGIEVSVNQATIATAGAGFENGSWRSIADVSSSFSWSGPGFSAGANIKGLVGPRFKLLLYNFVGPRADLAAFGEIDVDIFRTPIWQIFGGLEASVGVHLRGLADIEFPLVIQYRRLLAEGGAGGNGRIVGAVRDAITQQPLPNSLVHAYRDGNLTDSILTDGSGQFSIAALAGAFYRFEIVHPGYLPVIYNNVSVRANETKTLDVILQVDTAHAGFGNVSGSVFNAISGAGIPGLSLNVRQGLNTSSGPIVASTTTGSNGAYTFSNLPAGNYTAEAIGVGYNNSYFPVLCIGGFSLGDQNGVISPTLLDGQTRIVLTWGASPFDLDSHLTGPLPDGTRFHMFYPYADSDSGSPWPFIVHLDLDDTFKFGPETITLLQQINGVYRFSVHDYSNLDSTNSSVLSTSQAQVRVYRGTGLVATFNVPLGQPGTLWTVFEMVGSTITPINAMSYTDSPHTIQAPTRISPYDAALWQNLPPKH